MSELTEKQKKFIEEYFVNDFNATKAAIAAGYSEATAYSQGQRLLKNVEVDREIKRRCQEISAEYPLLRKRILNKLQKIAFSDLKDYLSYKTVKTEIANIEGESILGYKTVIDVMDSDNADTSVLSEVQETRDGFKFKRLDPLKALELLGKYTGLENAELDEIKKQIEEIKNLVGGNQNGG